MIRRPPNKSLFGGCQTIMWLKDLKNIVVQDAKIKSFVVPIEIYFLNFLMSIIWCLIPSSIFFEIVFTFQLLCWEFFLFRYHFHPFTFYLQVKVPLMEVVSNDLGEYTFEDIAD